MKFLPDIDHLMRRGDLAAAYDLCQTALNSDADDWRVRHRAILCLIRSGALERAFHEYNRLPQALKDQHEDMMVLKGRLLKAAALEASGTEAKALARLASRAYRQVYEDTGGFYPAINAASLASLSGDRHTAELLAQDVLNQPEPAGEADPQTRYYFYATQAEAYTLLGNRQGFAHMMDKAIKADPGNYAARAVTLNQIDWLMRDQEALDLRAWRGPGILHFAGSIFDLDSRSALDDTVNDHIQTVRQWVKSTGVGFAYGALAAGADIIACQALLDEGCSVHIVLPAPVEDFVTGSVAPFGKAWVKRFERIIRQVEHIQCVHDGPEGLSPPGIAFANQVAMGLALLRAETLSVKPYQLILAREASAPTSHSLRAQKAWSDAGQTSIALPVLKRVPPPQSCGAKAETHRAHSALRAMLFGDIRGFSQLADRHIPAFVSGVWKPLVACYRALSTTPIYENSWGDGLFLVYDTPEHAAEAALALQACFRGLDLEALGLPAHLALRLGGHYGPVHEVYDPVQDQETVFGGQVVIAARIEPLTPPGATYVSEAFGAVLALHNQGRYHCGYMGQFDIADIGHTALYSLRAAKNTRFTLRD